MKTSKAQRRIGDKFAARLGIGHIWRRLKVLRRRRQSPPTYPRGNFCLRAPEWDSIKSESGQTDEQCSCFWLSPINCCCCWVQMLNTKGIADECGPINYAPACVTFSPPLDCFTLPRARHSTLPALCASIALWNYIHSAMSACSLYMCTSQRRWWNIQAFALVLRVDMLFLSHVNYYALKRMNCFNSCLCRGAKVLLASLHFHLMQSVSLLKLINWCDIVFQRQGVWQGTAGHAYAILLLINKGNTNKMTVKKQSFDKRRSDNKVIFLKYLITYFIYSLNISSTFSIYFLICVILYCY